MRYHTLLLLLLTLILAPVARAQSLGEGSLAFTMAIPQGEFAEHVDNLGFGAGLTVGFRVPRTPLFLGVDGSFMVYGYDRREEPFSTTIPDVWVDVVTSNNILNGHLLARIQPPSGVVRPYLEGLFGFKYLYTDTRIEDDDFDDGEPIATSTNYDDFALSYGTGGGLTIQVYRGMMGEPQRLTGITLNAGLRYLFGGTAEYLKEGSIRRANGQVTYEVERSKTDMLAPYIGVGIAF